MKSLVFVPDEMEKGLKKKKKWAQTVKLFF